jgi:signal transduction histidine kinase
MHHAINSSRKDSVNRRRVRLRYLCITPILCILLLSISSPPCLVAQSRSVDSLRAVIHGMSDNDTMKVDQLIDYSTALRDAKQHTQLLDTIRSAKTLARAQGNINGLLRCISVEALTVSRAGNQQSAMAILKEALHLLGKATTPMAVIRVQRTLGLLFLATDDYDQALAAFHRAETTAKTLPDSSTYYDIVNLIGITYHDRGDNAEAAKYFHRLLLWSERLGDKKSLAMALANLANTMSGYDADMAIEYQQRSLSLIRESQDEVYGVGALSLTLANLYTVKKRFDEAAEAYREALACFEKLAFVKGILGASTGYAALLQRMENYTEALPIYQRSIELAGAIGDRGTEAHAHINLGMALQCLHDIDKAWEHAMKGYNLASTLGKLDFLMNAGLLLSDLAAMRGEHETALTWYKRYIAARDSVEGKETQQKIHAMREQYEAGAREKEIHSLRQESEMQSLMLVNQRNDLALRTAESDRRMQQLLLMERDRDIDALELERRQHELLIERSEREKREQQLQLLDGDSKLKASLLDKQLVLRNALLGTILLLLLLSAVSISRHRHKRKLIALRMRAAELQAQSAEAESMRLAAEKDRQEKEMQRAFSQQLIESQEQERKRIAGELHDSLGQGLLVIRNRAFLAKERLADPEKLSEQLDIIAETAAGTLSEVRQISRALRPYQLDRFGLTAAIEGLTTSVSEASSLRLDTAIEGIDGVLPQHAEINVFRVIQEAISNILKHAEASEASLRIRRENRHIAIEIRDNGKGFDAEPLWSGKLPEGAGLGLQGMIERIRMLDGSITIHSQPAAGTAVHIELPLSAGTDSPEQSASVEVAAAPAAGREAET